MRRRDEFAFFPLQHVHPGRLRRNPDIHVFGEKVNAGGHLLFGLLRQATQIVPALADAEARIRLLPDRFIKRVVAFVQGVDDGKEGIVLNRSFHIAVETAQYLDGIIAQLIADAFFIKAGGGNAEQQRLQARTGCCLQHVPDVTGFMGVQLVDNAAVDVQAVQVVRVAGKGLELRRALLLVDRQLVELKQAAQCRFRFLHHVFGIFKHDTRLVAGCGRRINLSAALAICTCHIQADAGGKCGFRILTRHLVVSGAEPPHHNRAAAIVAQHHVAGLLVHQRDHKPVDIDENENMPVHQVDGLTGLRALNMGYKFVEIQDVLRPGFAEEDPTRLAVFQIVQKTLACQPDKLTGNNLPRHDALGVADTLCNLSH